MLKSANIKFSEYKVLHSYNSLDFYNKLFRVSKEGTFASYNLLSREGVLLACLSGIFLCKRKTEKWLYTTEILDPFTSTTYVVENCHIKKSNACPYIKLRPTSIVDALIRSVQFGSSNPDFVIRTDHPNGILLDAFIQQNMK